MAIKKSELSWIHVADLKKAKHFFVDILGMKVASGESECHGWLELSGSEGGPFLGLAQASSQPSEGCNVGKPGDNSIMTFTVDSIEEAKKKFEAKGVNFIGEIIEVPGHVKLLFFKDADENTFQLVENLSP